MATYKLTADELLLIYTTMLARDEEGHHVEYFVQWFNDGGKDRLRNLFNSLKEKGFIHKDYNPSEYKPNEIEFNKNFLKSWYKNSLVMGMELFNSYPNAVNIQGKYFLLRDISKRFNSLDEFCFFYGMQIGHNIENHRKVMEILEWGKEQNLVNFNICNFTISHQWEALQQMRDNPEMIPISQNSIYTDD